MAKEIEVAGQLDSSMGKARLVLVSVLTEPIGIDLVQAGNKEMVPVERFREIVGTGFIFRRRQDGFNMWVAASKKAEHALVQMIRYLVNKRRQAELALLARKYYSEGRREIDLAQIAREIRMLNSKKGRRLEISTIRD
ncbi:MAG TPA: hypothetical protein VNA15_12350 [Candidatus Angelobacter sp.]|nr:hypothetical protein [Candidatus Angelobacter sp.]